MKNYNFLSFLAILFGLFVNAQTIKGFVYDHANQPLVGATIYFDGSTIGTMSQENGAFVIENKDVFQPILVVRFLGYETKYISDFSKQPLIIKLIEKAGELEEIEITPEIFSRKEMLDAFKREFLGTTSFGKKCYIENENDIQFRFKTKNKTLYAYADQPIIVVNPALGYRLMFNLIKLEVSFNKISLSKDYQRKSIFFGTSFFNEITNDQKIVKNRQKAYLGSSQHFFRTLIKNDWENQKFKIFEKGFQTNPKAHFEIKPADNYFEVFLKGGQNLNFKDQIIYSKRLSILYRNQQTDVVFNVSTINIDAFGNCSPIEKMTFNGEMSKGKIGHLLPLNYGFGNDTLPLEE